MMATRYPLFQFQGFQLFRAGIEDLWLADLWTDIDPHHRETTRGEFWVTNRPGVESYLLRDAQGFLFFARLERQDLIARRTAESKPTTWEAVELHIQFGPNEGERFLDPCLTRTISYREAMAMTAIKRERTVAGLVRGIEWLELALSGAGVPALFFNSQNPHLVRFSEKRLGFAQEGSKLLKWLIPSSDSQQNTGTPS